MSYEYVPKSEYTPVRERLEEIILKFQENLKPDYTFQFVLIGSGRKKLITRKKGANTGFDFDYNLLLQKTKSDDAQIIKKKFFEAIKDVAEDYGYKTKNGKTTINIKLVDQENSSIHHSCDFALINVFYDDYENEHQEIIVRNENSYIWNEKEDSVNYTYKLSKIEAAGLWHDLKSEYLKLKNNNRDKGKKSYHLFIEAINNVYNHYVWI